MRRKKAKLKKRRRRISGNPSFSPNVISGTRRRRKHKTYGIVRKHKRRVKGIGKVTGSPIGDLLLGFGVGVAANVVLNKFAPVDDKIKKYGGATVGGGLIYLGSKKKNSLMVGAGLGFATPGVMAIGRDMGLISGMDEFISGMGIGAGEDTMLIEMNGVDVNSTNLIGDANNQLNPSVVSGDENEEKVNGQFMNGSTNPLPNIISGY